LPPHGKLRRFGLCHWCDAAAPFSQGLRYASSKSRRATAGHYRGDRRQCDGVVRFWRLWLRCCCHWSSPLPERGCGLFAAGSVRCFCRGIFDAAGWEPGVWSHRRQAGTQARAHGFGVADGRSDVLDRGASHLPADRRLGIGATGGTAGLSVGGEYTTSSIFLVERSATGRRGFSWQFRPGRVLRRRSSGVGGRRSVDDRA
jgi:hypothetical protein